MTTMLRLEPRTDAARRCRHCACYLARDNDGDACWPCDRSRFLDAFTVPVPSPTGLTYRQTHELYERGLPALADALGGDTANAARVAWRAGLVPSRLRLDEDAFVTLATSASRPHTVIARRLGVSRWTVASWRRALPLTGSSSGST